MPGYDEQRIAQLEQRLAVNAHFAHHPAVAELEMLADLYLQADSYTPALETIDRLLALPEARALSALRRAGLESKAINCRLRQGDAQGALAHCREVLQDEAAIDHLPIRCKVHLQCGDALLALGRNDESAVEGDAALTLADRLGDLTMSAESLNLLGRVAYRRGDLETARDLYEQSLALHRRAGNEISAAFVRNNLGLIHKNLCEWDAAASDLKSALESLQRLSRYAETLGPLLNLGIVSLKRGDWTESAQWYAQARQVCVSIGDRLRLGQITLGLGTLARLERRFDESQALFEEALARARELRAQREEVLALEFLGDLDLDRGRPEEALTHYHEGVRLAERFAPESDLIVELERRRAEALLAVGRLEAAEASCQRASRLARLIDDRLEFAIAERVAGSLAWARGRSDDAFMSWKLAASLLQTCDERLELGRTYLEMGRFASDPVQARRYFYRAGSLFAMLSSPHWLEQSEQELHRLMTTAEAVPIRPASLLGRRHRAPGLVACSHAMRQVESLARRAANTELSVLVTGETGTGKELVARTIHGLSARAGKPFLAVNCGSLRADLALSQLFGHRKGAFTGAHTDGVGLVEAAHTGTLFLDEIGELPLDVQVTLLRFLESGEYMRLGETQVRRADVRIIAATNRELRGSDEKMFRRDLLFRLNEIEIRVPPLRDRREDIVPLARHFLTFYGGMDGPQLAPESEAMLVTHAWPGNVRELENMMKRVAALHAGDARVSVDALMPFLGQRTPRTNGSATRTTHEDDRTSILNAYAEARGNKSRVAVLLGVSRKTLYARLKRLNLELP